MRTPDAPFQDDDPKSEIVGELPEMQVRSSSKGGSPVESAMFSPKSALSSMQDPMSGVSGGKISGRPNAVEVPKVSFFVRSHMYAPMHAQACVHIPQRKQQQQEGKQTSSGHRVCTDLIVLHNPEH